MKFVDLATVNRDWDFSPLKPWSKLLPPIVWQGQQLTSFTQTEGQGVDLSHLELGSVLKSCYASLEIGELARLLALIDKTSGPDKNFLPQILRQYAYREREETLMLFRLISTMPVTFLKWLDSRTVALRELAIIHSAPTMAAMNQVAEHIARLEMSRSNGVRALELAGELLLLNVVLPKWKEADKRGEVWLKELQEARYPQTTARDLQAEQIAEGMPWPAHLQVNWQRQGDQAGLEVKFFASSAEDWRKRIASMRQIEDLVAEKSDLWKH